MLSRRLPEVAQAAHPRENAPCARRSRSNAAGRARTRTTRYARGSPRTRARGTHPTRAHTRARPTRAHTRARPTLGARAHARLTRATRTHTRAHTHTRARATSVDPRLRPCGADINSESSSSPPPALLSPQARSSPPPAPSLRASGAALDEEGGVGSAFKRARHFLPARHSVCSARLAVSLERFSQRCVAVRTYLQ